MVKSKPKTSREKCITKNQLEIALNNKECEILTKRKKLKGVN